MARQDGRAPEQLRPITIEPDYLRKNAVLVSFGDTRVLCYASIEDRVPHWLVGAGCGWIKAEYNMLPSAGAPRQQRERPNPSGRSQEIQRLIGRSLRAAVNLETLPVCTVHVDCDVLTADGGTRTASITGGMVALANLLHREARRFKSPERVFKCLVGAISVGVVEGEVVCDLNYIEDRDADVDANIVGLSYGGYAEVQATNEHGTFTRDQFGQMLSLADGALEQIYELQRGVLLNKNL